ADLIVPLSMMILNHYITIYVDDLTLEKYNTNRAVQFFGFLGIYVAGILCNSVTFWGFSLSIPKFRYLFIGMCCQRPPAGQQTA
ncbi:hypothetical protein PENTCL1PPCAC_307, partial [Pristionchus entomophagus]